MGRSKVYTKVKASDGTVKLLLQLPDFRLVETVGIPADGRLTTCVSSQVGGWVGGRGGSGSGMPEGGRREGVARDAAWGLEGRKQGGTGRQYTVLRAGREEGSVDKPI
jgi:hypothetical protein